MALAGKAIVVTGAGRGIGRACAELGAALGAAVVVNDIDRAAAAEVTAGITMNGGKAIVDNNDVAKWDAAERLVARCVDRFGSIDGLINNAARFRPSRLVETDEDIWRVTMEANVFGVAFMTTIAARRMVAQGRGAIVNMTSAAHQGARDLIAYGTSKGAVASLTYCAAMDLAPHGVRVNAVSPFAATRMIEAAAAFGAASGHLDTADMPTPEDNAPVACFLLSDAARHFAGQIVRVERDGLSMIGHPTILSPHAMCDTADYDAVAAAMAETIAAQQQPLGINRGRIAYL